MKKLILGISIITFTFIAACERKEDKVVKDTPEITIEVDNDIDDAKISELPDANISVYENILDNAYRIIMENGENEYAEEGITGIIESLSGQSVMDNLKRIGFIELDIDNNGIKELLIVDDGEEWNNRILALYTENRGKAELLADGWARNRYFLLDDNTIFNEGSSGAAYSEYGVYKISEDGKELSPIDIYFTDFRDEEMNDWGWFHNTNGSFEPKESEWLGPDDEGVYFSKMEEIASRKREIDLIYFIDYESDFTKKNAIREGNQ